MGAVGHIVRHARNRSRRKIGRPQSHPGAARIHLPHPEIHRSLRRRTGRIGHTGIYRRSRRKSMEYARICMLRHGIYGDIFRQRNKPKCEGGRMHHQCARQPHNRHGSPHRRRIYDSCRYNGNTFLMYKYASRQKKYTPRCYLSTKHYVLLLVCNTSCRQLKTRILAG